MSPPRFIVLEGIDGSGTTSQAAALAVALRARGLRVLLTHQPSPGPIGRLTRSLLTTKAGAEAVDPAALALLFAADRLHHLATVIRPALRRDELVLCDRYVVSAWAYQSLECPADWVRQINAPADWPDLTLFLEVDPKTAMTRVQQRRAQTAEAVERYDQAGTQARLADAYAKISRDPSLSGIVRIDASLPLDDVARLMLDRCVATGL